MARKKLYPMYPKEMDDRVDRDDESEGDIYGIPGHVPYEAADVLAVQKRLKVNRTKKREP